MSPYKAAGMLMKAAKAHAKGTHDRSGVRGAKSGGRSAGRGGRAVGRTGGGKSMGGDKK